MQNSATVNVAAFRQLQVEKVIWGRVFMFTFLFIASVTLVPLYVVHHGISRADAVLFIFWVTMSGFGITVGYHRLLAHRAFKAHPIVVFLSLFFGAGTFENSALRWACEHREHHRHTDEENDPYNIQKGFFHAHIGWIFFQFRRYHYYDAKDLIRNPLVRFQHRYYLLWALSAGVLLPFLTGLMVSDLAGALLIHVVFKMTFVHHGTFMVNSVAHYFGTKTYDKSVSARDFWPAAFLTFGEAYHNYHHRFPHDYRNGIKWYHWDPGKWWISFLSFLGLAWELKQASKAQIEKAIQEAART